MKNKASIIAKQKNEGTHVMSAGNLYRIIANGQETNGGFALMEATLKPGQGAPYHIHTREHEAFFILEGEVNFYHDNRVIHAATEGFVSCPPDSVRAFRNDTESDARMLLFYNKPGIEDMTQRDGDIVDINDIKNYTCSREIQCPTLTQEYGIKETGQPLPQKA